MNRWSSSQYPTYWADEDQMRLVWKISDAVIEFLDGTPPPRDNQVKSFIDDKVRLTESSAIKPSLDLNLNGADRNIGYLFGRVSRIWDPYSSFTVRCDLWTIITGTFRKTDPVPQV